MPCTCFKWDAESNCQVTHKGFDILCKKVKDNKGLQEEVDQEDHRRTKAQEVQEDFQDRTKIKECVDHLLELHKVGLLVQVDHPAVSEEVSCYRRNLGSENVFQFQRFCSCLDYPTIEAEVILAIFILSHRCTTWRWKTTRTSTRHGRPSRYARRSSRKTARTSTSRHSK